MAEKTFEESMDRLDEIVKILESGNKALEEAMALFEEGTKIIRSCSEILDNAEQRVVKLRRGPDGAPEETPFEEAE